MDPVLEDVFVELLVDLPADADIPIVASAPERTWIWSDLHLSDPSVLLGWGRPFRTDDPSVVEIGEAPLAAPQGHLLVGLNVDRVTFEQGCAGLGVCFAHGADQGGHAGILDALRSLPFGRKATMPAW